MDIIHDDYQVRYDAATATVFCQGSFRLRGTRNMPRSCKCSPLLPMLNPRR